MSGIYALDLKALKQWCEENRIVIRDNNMGALYVEGLGVCIFITQGKDQNVFITKKNKFALNIGDESFIAEAAQASYYIYQFGDIYYYTPLGSEDSPQFNVLKYVGKAIQDLDNDFAFLGMHGGYELLNGSRSYDDWCKKAKFLNHSALGICERNTLGGIISFQSACKKAKIKPIIGETIIVARNDDKNKLYEVKVYVQNKKGWRSLLSINREINVKNNGYVTETELFKRTEGLIAVVSGEYMDRSLIRLYKRFFTLIYYQFDLVEWRTDDRDKTHLNTLKKYIDSYFDEVSPILIQDAYYLDKEDSHIKRILNGIGRITYNAISNDQYYKCLDESFVQFEEVFKEDDDRLYDIFQQSIENAVELANTCDFQVDLGKLRLPKYEMTDYNANIFEKNEDLFFSILEYGMDHKIPQDKIDEYLERLEIEVEVITKGGFIDYFLTLWDIVEWCKKQKILTGIGRGSAGGSLIAYLMGITKLDPLKYGLLFERFLNESRIKESLPDIDVDFEGNRRNEVKKYMETRFGENYVCSVGSYTTFQARAVFTEVSKYHGKISKDIRPLSIMLDEEEGTWKDIFLNAAKKSKLKEYVKSNVDLINEMQLIIGQPKSASIHASAMLIVPKEDEDGNPMTIYDWLPLRRIEDGSLVCEWEGEFVEKAGFLKEDILGIRQLDKFRSMFDYIEENYQERLTLDDIPLNDRKTMELFRKGLNEDVFHFGSQGLKNFSMELSPESIEDLVAMIALHRPGAMESGSDKRYVKVKNGEELPEYDYMLEEVTKTTYAQYIYQEQVMKACQVLGGFSLVDADGVRRAMGKKIKDLMDSYKKQFLEHAINVKGCDSEEANQIWDKLELFSGYGFNKSHAAAYAITGYISQYLKAKYPLAFWTTAFQYAKDEDIPRYLDEVEQTGYSISISFPDINESDKVFTSNVNTNKLYWSLSRIKQVGEVAAEAIVDERNKKGDFYSLEEFYKRVPKNKCKRNVVENLILAGCFDEVHKDIIKDDPINRRLLIAELCDLAGAEVPKIYFEEETQRKYWWTLKQVTLSGKGYINYEELVNMHKKNMNGYSYVDTEDFFEDYSKGNKATIAGIVTRVIHQKMQVKDAYFAKVFLLVNDREVQVTIWNELWKEEDEWQNPIRAAEGCILIIDGTIDRKEPYNRENILQTNPNSKYKIIERK